MTIEQPKRRGGTGGLGTHHARNVPPITRAEVDECIGPDAATLSPAERFARFVRRVVGAAKPTEE